MRKRSSAGSQGNVYGELFAHFYDTVWAPGVRRVSDEVTGLYAMSPLFQKNGWVLDVGCGTGQVTRRLVRQGCRVLGIDPSVDMLRLAKKRLAAELRAGKVLLRNCTVQDLKTKRRFGMAIATYGVIHHLPNRKALTSCFAAIRRRLEPGGMFMTDFFAEASFTEVWDAANVDVGEWKDVVFLKRSVGDRVTGTAYVSVTAFHKTPRGLYRRSHTTLRLKIHPLADIAAALKAAGFKDVVFFRSHHLMAAGKQGTRKIAPFTRSPGPIRANSYVSLVAANGPFPPRKALAR